MEIEKKLDEAIESAIDDVNALNGGSDEKVKASEAVAKLVQSKIDYDKAQNEKTATKRREIKDWVNIGLQTVVPIAGFIFYDVWLRKALHFEEFGTIKSPMTRGLLQKILPKK